MTERWWLAPGTEVCEQCEQRYVYEVEVRCVDCDAPLCPICAVHVRARKAHVCASCGESDEGEG